FDFTRSSGRFPAWLLLGYWWLLSHCNALLESFHDVHRWWRRDCWRYGCGDRRLLNFLGNQCLQILSIGVFELVWCKGSLNRLQKGLRELKFLAADELNIRAELVLETDFVHVEHCVREQSPLSRSNDHDVLAAMHANSRERHTSGI